MKLSKRLKQVAEQVIHADVTADVGCDHGFTSIYLVRTGRTKRAIAMDIGREPLLRAKEHVVSYQMQEKIELRRSDGLERLEKGEADALLISGIGGRLMCRILKEGEEKVTGMKQLILSPQSDIPMVRRLLHEMGFCIERERMVCDQKKYYVIIRAVPGDEKYEAEEEYLYGRYLIGKKDEVFIEFLKRENRKTAEVISRMEESRLSAEGELCLKKQKKTREQILRILHKMGIENIPEEVTDDGKKGKGYSGE